MQVNQVVIIESRRTSASLVDQPAIVPNVSREQSKRISQKTRDAYVRAMAEGRL